MRRICFMLAAALWTAGCGPDDADHGQPTSDGDGDDFVLGDSDGPPQGDGDGTSGDGDGTTPTLPACPSVTVQTPPAALGLDAFYTQYIDSGGIPVVASAAVSPAALRVAHYKIANLLAGKPCVRRAIMAAGVRVGIIARTQVLTDMPEYEDLYTAFPGLDWDERGGLGATLGRPLTCVAEENLLRQADDPYLGASILVHELGHTYFDFGVLDQSDGDAQQARLTQAFNDAMARGAWANTYSTTNSQEYWAEGVQCWFDANIEAIPTDGIHNEVNTRAELTTYDPPLTALLGDTLPTHQTPAFCSVSGGTAWTDPTPANPLAASCNFSVTESTMASCSTESGTTSGSGTDAATLTVVNRSSAAALKVYWLDGTGQRVLYGTIEPRSSLDFFSYATYAWVVTTPSDTCLGVVTTPAGRTRIFVD